LNIKYLGAYLKLGEKEMRLNSAAAPATVNDDEPYINHSAKGKGKVRMIHKPGDLPIYS